MLSKIQRQTMDVMLRSMRLTRADIFGDRSTDRPHHERDSSRDLDSDIPQIGFVGSGYRHGGLVAVGYNPGNGGLDPVRRPGDETMIPILERFRDDGDPTAFSELNQTGMSVAQSWSIWRKHVEPWLTEIEYQANDIGYLNINPFRTKSKAKFDQNIWDVCWERHLSPLLHVLRPRIVVCLGKNVYSYLIAYDLDNVSLIEWNRSQAATRQARRERLAAIQKMKVAISSPEQA